MKTRPTHNSGITLVITLIILVLVTIIVVAFTISMRLESRSAAAMANSVRADLMARSAVNHFVGVLGQNIPSVSPLRTGTNILGTAKFGSNWWTNPGQLSLLGPTTIHTANPTKIALHSGVSTPANAATDPNLNRKNFNGTTYPIDAGGTEVRVAWVDVLRDPAAAPNAVTNPVIGRYAFWGDDENSKININTALTHTSVIEAAPSDYSQPQFQPPGSFAPPTAAVVSPAFRLGHPASVDLSAVDPTFLVNYGQLADAEPGSPRVGKPRELGSVADIGKFISDTAKTAQFFNKSKFLLTAYNRDPEFSVFGKPRINVGINGNGDTAVRYETYQDYYDVTEPLMFPTSRFDYARQNAAIRTIAEQLNSPWPGFKDESFALKWGNGNAAMGLREIDQVAINIWGMANFANAQAKAPAANQYLQTDGTGDAKVVFGSQTFQPYPQDNDARPEVGKFLWQGPLSGARIVPQTRCPLINEIAISITPQQNPSTTTNYDLKIELKVELYLPPGYAGVPWRLDNFSGSDGQNTARSVTPFINVSYFGYTYVPPLPAGTSPRKVSRLSPNGGTIDENEPRNNLALRIGGQSGVSIAPGEYKTLTTDSTYHWISETNISGPSVTLRDVKFKLLSYMFIRDEMIIYQYCPVRHQIAAAGTESGSLAEPGVITIPGDIVVPLDGSYTPVVRSVEIEDPRLNHLASQWKVSTDPSGNTLGRRNSILPVSPPAPAPPVLASNLDGDESKLAFVSTSGSGEDTDQNYRMVSSGMLSLVHTGMQSGRPWRTINLGSGQMSGAIPGGNIPDYLLFDLLNAGGSQQKSSGTTGRINLNGGYYPRNPAILNDAGFSLDSRQAVFEGLFKNLKIKGTDVAASTLASAVIARSKTQPFQYAGELAEVPGITGAPPLNQWEREALMRNLIGLVTTRSNTFTVWGVGQAIQQLANGTKIVTGEKRFQALVERYVWPGVDGAKGNYHVAANGTFDRRSGRTLSHPIDGPDMPVVPILFNGNKDDIPGQDQGPISTASNPMRAWMKYRVANFQYLSE